MNWLGEGGLLSGLGCMGHPVGVCFPVGGGGGGGAGHPVDRLGGRGGMEVIDQNEPMQAP